MQSPAAEPSQSIVADTQHEDSPVFDEIEQEQHDRPMKPPSTPLCRVIAYIEVYNDNGTMDAKEPIKQRLVDLGAKVLTKFVDSVTHVVFKDGSEQTFTKAKDKNVITVSPLWVQQCHQLRMRVSEFEFLASPPSTKLTPSETRKMRSMQPSPSMDLLDPDDEVFSSSQRMLRSQTPPQSITKRKGSKLGLKKGGKDKQAKTAAPPATPTPMMTPTSTPKANLNLSNLTTPTPTRGDPINDSVVLETQDVADPMDATEVPQTPVMQMPKTRIPETPEMIPSMECESGMPIENNCGDAQPAAEEEPQVEEEPIATSDSVAEVVRKLVDATATKDTSPAKESPSAPSPASTKRKKAASGGKKAMNPTGLARENNASETEAPDVGATKSPSKRTPDDQPSGVRPGKKQKIPKRLTKSANPSTVAPSRDKENHPPGKGKSLTAKSQSRNNDVKGSGVRIALTSLDFSYYDIADAAVKVLGGRVEEKPSARVSHVVCGPNAIRTLKVLYGIASGAWLVTEQWLLRSLEERRWLDPKPFEINYFSGAKVSRSQKDAGKHDLLKGMSVAVVGQTRPEHVDLELLVKLCGGQLAKQPSGADVTVLGRGGKIAPGDCDKVVKETWILDGIAAWNKPAFKNYLVTSK